MAAREELAGCDGFAPGIAAGWSGAMLSSVKVIAGWVLALLAVVGVGTGIEGAVGGGSRTGLGNVDGVLRITRLSCPLPPGWAAGYSVTFDRYIRDNVVVVPCTGSLGDGGQVCTLPQWSGPPVLAVPIAAGGRFTATLAPGSTRCWATRAARRPWT